MKKQFLTTECIILRRFPYRETSYLVHTLTKDFGKVDFVVKGCAPGKKGQGRDIPELFREYTVEYAPKKSRTGSNLHTPHAFELAKIHDNVAKGISSYLEACRFADFLLRNTREEQELSATFSAFSALLSRLEEKEARGKEEFLTDLAFFVYLEENGLLPEMPREEDAKVFSSLLAYAKGEIPSFPPCPEDYPARLHIYLHALLGYHHLAGKK